MGHRDKRGRVVTSQERSLSPRPASCTVDTDFLSAFALWLMKLSIKDIFVWMSDLSGDQNHEICCLALDN